MRKPRAVFVIAVTAAIRAVPGEAETNEIAFTHVAVVDVQSGKIPPDMTVLISGQKIPEVGSSRVVHVPKQAHSADARGKYLIPGVWDMHVHSLWDAERPAMFFPLFLANGVRGVREMGGPMPAADRCAGQTRSLRRGDWPSPGRPRSLRRRSPSRLARLYQGCTRSPRSRRGRGVECRAKKRRVLNGNSSLLGLIVHTGGRYKSKQGTYRGLLDCARTK
jgi:hypothetical protein